MSLDKWDRRFLRIAGEVSTWSKDPSTQVGAVAVRDRRILATGYNGFPAGIDDNPSRLSVREEKHKYVVHAETNVVYNAVNNGVTLDNSTVYVYNLPPCSECTKALMSVGVKRIVAAIDEMVGYRWTESYELSKQMMLEAGLEFETITKFYLQESIYGNNG